MKKSTKLLDKFLRIRLQNTEIYSFTKQITALCCAIFNIPIFAIYAGERKIRFYGVSTDKDEFSRTINLPYPTDFNFFPVELSTGNSQVRYHNLEMRRQTFLFSSFEISFVFLCSSAHKEQIEQNLQEIHKDIAMLLLPMIQDDEFTTSSRLKESLRIANNYVQSFSFIESLISLVLSIVQLFCKAEYIECTYCLNKNSNTNIVSIGEKISLKCNTHAYSSNYEETTCQISVASTSALPNSPSEMYRLNRTSRLTAKLISEFSTHNSGFYYKTHIIFTKIHETLLSQTPGILDQKLDVALYFANIFTLTKEERFILNWLIVLDQSGNIAMKLLTSANNESWEIDYSFIVKKAIISNLGIPLKHPEIVEIDKNLFHAIITCANSYPFLVQNDTFKNRTDLILEIRKLEVPENFLPLFLKCIEKNFSKYCFEITHCSTEFREICPIYKQINQGKMHRSRKLCYELDCLRNQILGLQCKQCIVYKKKDYL
ncbi:MAG: hypothetical protein KAH01_04635 [Caldisericia bacterium]|nr:hypothetical protein [Caldisericia bacterium]